MVQRIHLKGQPVPVVAFYSVQGGVGKSTIARKFAELVTRAKSPGGQHPNVLLVDLDVEASGLTYRIMGGAVAGGGTVHEAIAAGNPNVARAHNVTAKVAIASAGVSRGGELYLLPAAPPGETRLFEVIKNTDTSQLLDLLQQTVERLVDTFAISCVVIDCAPGGMPYSAAAATIADVPVFIGRNESASYDQIHVQTMRFKELFPQFQPTSQKVVINAVALKDIYEQRARQHDIEDWIPLTSDVIHETEGSNDRNRESLRMLLFENYIIDLIRRFLVGRDHLIPTAHNVLSPQYHAMLRQLERVEEAPKLKRLRLLAKACIPAGLIAIVCGIVATLMGDAEFLGDLQTTVERIRLGLLVLGAAVIGLGIFSMRERVRVEKEAQKLTTMGAEGVFALIKNEQTHRNLLEEMRLLSETIPRPPRVAGNEA
jgi:MinD-like ATPase involved in chromosome partitioning or flagellar assembly